MPLVQQKDKILWLAEENLLDKRALLPEILVQVKELVQLSALRYTTRSFPSSFLTSLRRLVFPVPVLPVKRQIVPDVMWWWRSSFSFSRPTRFIFGLIEKGLSSHLYA